MTSQCVLESDCETGRLKDQGRFEPGGLYPNIDRRVRVSHIGKLTSKAEATAANTVA